VALGSDLKKQMKPEEVEELLDGLEKLLDRTKVLYEQYFMGIQKIAPMQLHRDIERRVRDLMQQQIRNTSLRFRFTTISQKYGAYNTYWKRTLREIEQGKYVRDLVRVKRKADELGEDLPEELLVKLPKLVQDRIRRDRARMAERARRSAAPEAISRSGELVTRSSPPVHEIDEEEAATLGESLVEEAPSLFGAGDLDIDGLFHALTAPTEDGSPPAVAPSVSRKARETAARVREAPTSAEAPVATEAPEAREAPDGRDGREATQAGADSLEASERTKAPEARDARDATAPERDATGDARDAVPEPVSDATSEPERDAPKEPTATRTTTTAVGPPPVPRAGTSPPRPAATPPPIPQGARSVTVPLPKGLSQTRAPTAPPVQGFRVPPPPGTSRAATAPPPDKADRPEKPTGPAKPERPEAKASVPPAAAPAPPPGMDDKQCRELYTRYLKARQLVGEKNEDVTYEKLVSSLNKQASAIMTQHGARGVEFHVVVRGDRVVLKAKPLKPGK
jgi:hypothetical protein